MTVLLAQDLVVGLAFELFLDSSSFTLMQSDDVVFLPHFITVDGAESRGKTTERGETENTAVLDTVVRLAGEGGTKRSVNDARAAVGYISDDPRGTY